MIPQETLLITLVKLVDRVPLPPKPPSNKRGRGREQTYSDRLFLKALVIMIVRRLYQVGTLWAVLHQPTAEMQTLWALLSENGRHPCERTFRRRLAALPDTLPALIGCLGRHLVACLTPWEQGSRAVAIDSSALRAKGGVWHKKDREADVVPHTCIDTEAGWTKSGWHGWVYGCKLHIVCTVASIWIPLAADLTPANVADNEQAALLLPEVPTIPLFVLGDQHYNAPNVRQCCLLRSGTLVATQRGAYPHTGPGVEVRRIFHKLRSLAIENFNEHFKGIFEVHEQVPTKGLVATKRFALGAIFLYQLALLYRFEQGLSLRNGLKAFLRAA